MISEGANFPGSELDGATTTDGGDDMKVERKNKRMIQEQPSLKLFEPFIPFPAFLKAKYQKRKSRFLKFLNIFNISHGNAYCIDDIVKMLNCA